MSNLDLLEEPSAPRSPTGVLRTRFPRGLRAGRGPVHVAGWDDLQRPTEYDQIYFSMWVRVVGRDFENQAVATKFSFFAYGDRPGGSHNQGTLWLKNVTGRRSTRHAYPLAFTYKSFRRQPGQWLSQNRNPHHLFTVGTWHRVELHLKLSGGDARDGMLRVWLDGVLVLDHAHLKLQDSRTGFIHGFWSYVWNPTWGGNNSDVKTRDDFVDIDHIYLSGQPRSSRSPAGTSSD